MNYNDKAKDLLDDLLKPIPFMVRPMARKQIEKVVFSVAQEHGHDTVEYDDVVRGYILAGKQRDNSDKMVEALKAQGVDLSKYQDLLG